jgi:hypothetical protein
VAIGIGEHPQSLAPAVPPLQVFGVLQVFGQETAEPQLLVAGPHALPWQLVAVGSGVQPQIPVAVLHT